MRSRIITLAIAATVLAVILFGVPLAVFIARYSWEDQRIDLGREAAAAALAVSDELRARSAPELPDAPRDTRLGLYSETGRLLTGKGPASADATVRDARRGEIEVNSTASEFVAAVPIVEGNTLLGVVRAAKPHSATTLRTGVLWASMAALAAVAVGVAWLLARRMAGRLARPLEELAAGAKVLGDGDFTVRTSLSGVPEIDSVGEALQSTARRIGDTLDRERAFSAHASHQLRTPLAGLRLQLEAALESPGDPRPAIRTGIEAADRLEQTVDDLLALARDTSTSPVADLDALLSDLESAWRGPLAAQGRALSVTSRSAPRPRAAEAAIRQILNVLVDNAVTHGRGTVGVDARDAGDTLAIDVCDEGDGVAPGQDIFTRRVGSEGGHGIGLALARSLAEAEGGRLVHAAGATFTLLLPIP
ncbi:HAMP domain-containing sensor histidine kinase [Streptomyces sp. NPDC055709]